MSYSVFNEPEQQLITFIITHDQSQLLGTLGSVDAADEVLSLSLLTATLTPRWESIDVCVLIQIGKRCLDKVGHNGGHAGVLRRIASQLDGFQTLTITLDDCSSPFNWDLITSLAEHVKKCEEVKCLSDCLALVNHVLSRRKWISSDEDQPPGSNCLECFSSTAVRLVSNLGLVGGEW